MTDKEVAKRAPHSLPTDAIKYGLPIKAWLWVVGLPVLFISLNRHGIADWKAWLWNVAAGGVMFMTLLALAYAAVREDVRAAELWVNTVLRAIRGKAPDEYDHYTSKKIVIIED